MVNSCEFLTIDEVHTPAERVHFVEQECASAVFSTTFYTYIAGTVVIPLLLKSFRNYLPMPIEYKVASGSLLAVVFSYFAGVRAKRRCEEDINRQLDEKFMA